MRNVKVVLLGGDRREVELYRCWKETGLQVSLLGFEDFPGLNGDALAGPAHIREADVLIAPLSGIKGGGAVAAPYAAEPLFVLPYINRPARRCLLLAGSVDPCLKPELESKAALVLTGEDPELALLNSIPTAEGAIQQAMEFSDITLHGSRTLVLGFGRCGATLALALRGLGAAVTVVVRRGEAAALVSTMQLTAVFFTDLARAAGDADFIFNTVPARVLPAVVLQGTKPDCLIIDLAASPGGTDFQAARELGRTALLLPGLPGRVAPRSAARILDRIYRRMIGERWGVSAPKREEEKEEC
jgi:dipicolinate synthase subunit A